MLDIRVDDLSGQAVRDLLTLHLAGMHEHSPPGHVFALDVSGLQASSVTVWTAWSQGALAGIGALKVHADGIGEVKSMRTDPAHLRKGVGAAILDRIVDAARERGCHTVSLETGFGPAFEPAVALYRRRGFVVGEPFADYEKSEFNQMLHLAL